MLTENTPPLQYVVKVNGIIVSSNLPSKQLAENVVFGLPPEQRAVAVIEPTTATGQTLLFG